jgi:hypothetical protein
MITHRPAIDWLTLTTFELKTVIRMVDMIEPLTKNKETAESRVMQYDGRRGEGFFIGHGQQKGKEHHMFRFSGDLADAVTWQPLRPPIDCSRIDLQLTLPLPCKISDSFELFVDLMRVSDEHELGRGPRARNVDGVLSPDGFCTMYLGSREGSGRFYRLYVKESTGEYFLRMEVEYKGKNELAGKVWRETARRPESIVEYLKGEISTLPMHELTRPFHEALQGVAGDIMKNERRRADPQKTLAWLRRQVSPAMKRLLGNHDTHDAAMIIMMDWLKFVNRLDDI